MNVNLVAVGLLYRFGYFTQVLSSAGDQIAKYDAQDFSKIPASPVRDKDGGWVTVAIALPGRNLTARIWKVEVGRTDLYLLDTDFEANAQEDREITYHLYGGDWEDRLKQEMLLGLGEYVLCAPSASMRRSITATKATPPSPASKGSVN